MRLRIPVIALGIAGSGLLPGAASAGSGTTVRIKDFAFMPAIVHVDKGSSVTWRSQQKYVSHNVTSRGKQRFTPSQSLPEGATYSVQFRQAGTYRYVCTIHAGMKGRVVVG